MTEPIVEQLDLPPDYGKPSKLLKWADVRKQLEDAPVYWVTSVRPNGHPHVVPRDGIWLDHTWYYGGSPETVHSKNIQKNPAVNVHIGDGMEAIIVEGEAHHVKPPKETSEKLAEINNTKYAHYGMNMKAETYMTRGIWAVEATRIIAWKELFTDATRFRFE
jgi:general stress protein 26